MTFDTRMRLGVLDDGCLLTYDYRQKKYNTLIGVETDGVDRQALYLLAREYNLDTVWITPGTRLSARANALMSDEGKLQVIGSKKRDGTPRFSLAWFGSLNSVKIGWPEWDDRWPWQRCTDSKTLLLSILYLQDAMEAEIAWSPGHVGQQLMIDLNSKRADWLQPADLPSVVRDNLAVDMQWKRELTEEERGEGEWFHLFDKNFSYGAACTGVTLGEGSPVHVEKFDLFNARIPGLWRVGKDWMWTPEVEALLLEYPEKRLAVGESWQWPKYHQTLRTWGEHMWEARCKLKPAEHSGVSHEHQPAQRMAYQAAKPIANQGLGWLAMEAKRGDNKLYRPDWWSMVVAHARRSMMLKMRQLAAINLPACYVNVDAIGLVSDGPSLEPFQNTLMLREGQLGGFKHVKSVRLGKERWRVFGDDVSFRECQNEVLSWQ